MPMRITAITRRQKAIVPSYISQVAPSESSVIKRVAYEPLFLRHLRDENNIKGVKKSVASRAIDRLASGYRYHL